jgi:hypothetical protein
MGSGGGGSSGSVNYPEYMKQVHNNFLTQTAIPGGVDNMNNSIIDLMNNTHSVVSPYDSFTATDPDTIFFNAGKTITDYDDNNPYELLEDFVDWDVDAQFTTYAAETNPLTTAYTSGLQDEVDEKILPQFMAGHADMNSVMSSAFVIGKSLIAGNVTREVAKFDGQLKTDMIMRRMMLKMEWNRLINVVSLENSRIYLAAKHEEDESNLDAAAKDGLWDLEVYQYGGNILAAIAGTAVSRTATSKPSTLGAAMTGAAAGALVGAQIGAAGGPIGAGAGALIGGALGIASTL